jgi:hypothetical protein
MEGVTRGIVRIDIRILVFGTIRGLGTIGIAQTAR